MGVRVVGAFGDLDDLGAGVFVGHFDFDQVGGVVSFEGVDIVFHKIVLSSNSSVIIRGCGTGNFRLHFFQEGRPSFLRQSMRGESPQRSSRS